MDVEGQGMEKKGDKNLEVSVSKERLLALV